MAEEQVQPKVLIMTLKTTWNFPRHTKEGTVNILKGPGEFRVIKTGQRLVFMDDPETGIDEAYALCWAHDYCKEHQIIIIDPEKEKAKKEAEERTHRPQQELAQKEEVFKQEVLASAAAAPKISQEVKKEIEEENIKKSKEKTDVLSDEELSKVGKFVKEK